MAYNYLGLVNDMANRVNETELTSSNFASAVGVYGSFKNAVNASIDYLGTQQYEWPSNHTTYDETLVAGTSRYAYQSDAKTVDFDTFRVQRDATFGNDTQHLRFIDYDEYVHKYIDAEYDTSTSIRDTPRFISRAPDNQYVVYPVPDEAYTLTYEYWTITTPLSSYDDIPAYPSTFRTTIVDGAMFYHYFFRGDTETSDRLWSKFDKGVDNLRRIYINNDYQYVRDTRIPVRGAADANYLRTN